jgi:hypothetical protein
MSRRTQKKTHKNHVFRKSFRLMESKWPETGGLMLHRAPVCRAAIRRTMSRVT